MTVTVPVYTRMACLGCGSVQYSSGPSGTVRDNRAVFV